jgi:hypothetical protein
MSSAASAWSDVRASSPGFSRSHNRRRLSKLSNRGTMSLYTFRPLRWLNMIHFLAPHLSLQGQRDPLPYQQFQALLTLFSKFFSSFPHGTCSLSVSHQYLALDDIYHPLSAPFPRNATLCIRTEYTVSHSITGLSPSMAPHSRGLNRVTAQVTQLETTIHNLAVGIYILCSSLFNRLYWGNHSYFLFLRLIICLNPAGSLV